jgi:hypothetical protein
MIPRPPPIFVYNIIKYPQMINHLAEITEEENYSTRSMANNIIKINCNSPETYRKMITFMKENIIYHSYQPKDEKPYRVVIKHLHHTVDLKDIINELSGLGHKVRNIINTKHRQMKEPLNLFFVDLEPADNNMEVYKITVSKTKLLKLNCLINLSILSSAHDANYMAMPRCIVICPTCVSNAEDNTTQQLAQTVKVPLQNVVSVESWH